MNRTTLLAGIVAALACVGCGGGTSGPQPAPDGARHAGRIPSPGDDAQSGGPDRAADAFTNGPTGAGRGGVWDGDARARRAPDASDAGFPPRERDVGDLGTAAAHADAVVFDVQYDGVDAGSAPDAASSGPPNPCAGGGPAWNGPIVTKDVQITTADGVVLAATAWAPKSGTCLPAVLLVHQFQLSRHQWDAKAPDLASAGRVVLAIDLRGHGDSDPVSFPLTELLTAPDQAPRDVAAALDWLETRPGVDAARIAVVGTSIGANLAVVAALGPHAPHAVVAISPRLEAIAALAAVPAADVALGPAPILCLAAELDGGGAQAETCEVLVATSTDPASKALVFPGVSHHGIALINVVDGAWGAVGSWLEGNL